MRKTVALTMTLVGVVTSGAVMEADAQQRRGQRDGARSGPQIEAIMRMQEQLELTDEQLGQLDALRRDRVAERSEEQAAMAEMRSRLAAGLIERSEMMAFMEERRDANRERAEQQSGALESILTEDQLGSVAQLRTRTRAFQRGRASAGPGRGMRRGGRGLQRGGRGMQRGGRGAWRGERGARGRGFEPGRSGARFERFGPGLGAGGAMPWRRGPGFGAEEGVEPPDTPTGAATT